MVEKRVALLDVDYELKGACIWNEHTLEVPKFVQKEGEVVKSVVV
jgi:hypothetical protein